MGNINAINKVIHFNPMQTQNKDFEGRSEVHVGLVQEQLYIITSLVGSTCQESYKIYIHAYGTYGGMWQKVIIRQSNVQETKT